MKPKAHVSKATTALHSLEEMLDTDPELYDKCISTVNFAFHFSQLVNRAVHYDYIVENILPDYPEKESAEHGGEKK